MKFTVLLHEMRPVNRVRGLSLYFYEVMIVFLMGLELLTRFWIMFRATVAFSRFNEVCVLDFVYLVIISVYNHSVFIYPVFLLITN